MTDSPSPTRIVKNAREVPLTDLRAASGEPAADHRGPARAAAADAHGGAGDAPREAVDRSVYDPFAGAGSTMIASEKLGRRALLVEIDPGYCDVVRQRYADYVGDQTFAP